MNRSEKKGVLHVVALSVSTSTSVSPRRNIIHAVT